MSEDIKCSQYDVKQNKKLSHIFPLQASGRCQSIKESNVTHTICKEQDYLNERNIFNIFHFLLSHVIIHQPADPIQYLYELLDDFILFRSGLKEPRLLWTEKHLNAIFENILFHDSEFLPLDGFKTAMKTMGVRSYDPCPDQLVRGYVDRQTFCTEASNSMKNELLHMATETSRRT
uniref:uncharacterized protein LOC117160827 n=1 Tax=Bombus vancouverensis nearcticus TaxID=2705178 RepID=UPI00143C34AF|nr:uncharacterized protein LOC117160827 [Bombus vancouverensis nearcticus]